MGLRVLLTFMAASTVAVWAVGPSAIERFLTVSRTAFMDFAASLSRGWQMGIGAALVLAIAAFGVLILHRKRRKRESVARGPDAARRTAQDAAAKPSGVEKKFKTIFFNKSEADLERTIALWMNKKQCSRDAAMQHAIEHYQQETRSWR